MEDKITHDRINKPGAEDKIFFYPKEFYVFDNFSSFQIEYNGFVFPTSEHAYQAMKFIKANPKIFEEIKKAKSAHEAQKLAMKNKDKVDLEWEKNKIHIMKSILKNKIDQHPYILKKLLQSGEREIIEDSWRDEIWGWGKNKDGKNLLGKIWMELREEYMNEKKLL
ncbi:MAG: NADAR family protein [Candidatus Pacearchaeota archaeon]|jgi:ribA/ribD-fused uncharacterized protein